MTILSTLFAVLAVQTDVAPIIVYEDCGYQGWALPLSFSYTAEELDVLGADYVIKNVSSIRVADGYQVTLYARENFAGRSLTLTDSRRCLVAEGFNDRMVSIAIERAE